MLAGEIRELQGEMADYNTLMDKLNTDTEVNAVLAECSSVSVHWFMTLSLLCSSFSLLWVLLHVHVDLHVVTVVIYLCVCTCMIKYTCRCYSLCPDIHNSIVITVTAHFSHRQEYRLQL